jgi:nicotinate-nucleotide--dimethylbenzimidazole phosphoribosyltransferase
MAAETLVGRGTGIDDESLRNKIRIIELALEKNRPNASDGLDVLSKVGGFEIGGIAGCLLAGAYHRRPVVIDGFISTAGALIAHALCPTVAQYLFAGHRSQEPGHRIMLEHLGLEPIIDLGLRLGEGTGAALAMGVIESATRIFREVLTFEEAGVTSNTRC